MNTKATVSIDHVLNAVKILGMVTTSSDNLSHSAVRISGKKGSVRLLMEASAPPLSARVMVEAEEELEEEVDSIISAPLLFAAVRSSNATSMGFTFKKNSIGITSGTFKANCPVRNDLDISVFDFGTAVTRIEVNYTEFTERLRRVSWLPVANSHKMAFTCPHIIAESDDRVKFFGSDSIAIMVVDSGFTVGDFINPEDIVPRGKHKLDIPIPMKFSSMVERLSLPEDTSIRLSTNASWSMLAMSVPGVFQIATQVYGDDAAAPVYEAITSSVGSEGSVEATVDRKTLFDTLTRLNALMAADKARTTRVVMDITSGDLKLKSASLAYAVEDSLPYTAAGGEIFYDHSTITVDSGILARAARNVSTERVTLVFPPETGKPLFMFDDLSNLFVIQTVR